MQNPVAVWKSPDTQAVSEIRDRASHIEAQWKQTLAEVTAARDELIAEAKTITVVFDQATAERSANIQKALKRMDADLEDARKMWTKPVFDLFTNMNADAKAFGGEAAMQRDRLNKASVAYARKMEDEKRAEQQRIEQQRLEAQRIEEARLAEIDRKKRISEEAEARAERARTEHGTQKAQQQAEDARKEAERLEAESLAAALDNEAEALSTGQELAHPEIAGQKVAKVWKWEITNMHAFAQNFPDLVKMEPKTREINEAIKARSMGWVTEWSEERQTMVPTENLAIVPGMRIWEDVEVKVR